MRHFVSTCLLFVVLLGWNHMTQAATSRPTRSFEKILQKALREVRKQKTDVARGFAVSSVVRPACRSLPSLRRLVLAARQETHTMARATLWLAIGKVVKYADAYNSKGYQKQAYKVAFAALSSARKTETKQIVRAYITMGIMEMRRPTPEVIRVLLSALNDPAPAVRINALLALYQFNQEKKLASWLPRLSNDSSAGVRKWALIIAHLNNDKQIIRKGLRDRDHSVQVLALVYAVEMKIKIPLFRNVSKIVLGRSFLRASGPS
jgi:hypothetical protein